MLLLFCLFISFCVIMLLFIIQERLNISGEYPFVFFSLFVSLTCLLVRSLTNSKLALILDIIEYYLACIVSFVWSLAYILGIFFVLILLILERIKKAWEDLIKEKEKGYDKEKYKEYSSSYKEYKSKRYFKEFEKFDLENFEKNNPYEVLGVLKGATEKEITKAYKGLMAKYHPDRFAHEGELEKIKEAEKIARLINWGREGCLKI